MWTDFCTQGIDIAQPYILLWVWQAAGADKLKPLLAKEVKTALDWLGGESCGHYEG